MKKILAVKLQENFRVSNWIPETYPAPPKTPDEAFERAQKEIPLVDNYQQRLNQIVDLGYEFVTVDNGIAYFKKVEIQEMW